MNSLEDTPSQRVCKLRYDTAVYLQVGKLVKYDRALVRKDVYTHDMKNMDTPIDPKSVNTALAGNLMQR